LPNALDAAGRDTARHDRMAFLPISDKPIDITAVLQKVYLNINEQGSEAAAATSVIARSFTVAPKKEEIGYIGSVLSETTQ
jgi:serine protease inhibitor